MAKLTLSNLANLNNQTSAVNTINANSDLIELAIENTLSRDGTSPNSMSADLDMDGNDILNVGNIFVDGAEYVSDSLNELGFVDFTEIVAPGAPEADKARLYAVDASGSTVLAYKDHVGVAHKLVVSDSSNNVSALGNVSQTGYHDLQEMSAPGSPSANTARIFSVDSSGTTKLAVKDNAGTTHDLTHFTQSGTGAALRTQEAKLRETFSAKDFGALGDDSNDDTAEIQAAITALEATATGGVLELPPGTYRIDTVTIAGTKNITIKGAAKGVSRIRFIGTGSNTAAFGVADGVGNSVVVFEDVTWVAPTTSTTARAVSSILPQTYFANCWVEGGYRFGFELLAAYASTLRDCIFVSTRDYAVVMDNGTGQNTILDGCKFFDCGNVAAAGAVYNNAAENTIFRDCDFEGNRIDIFLQDCTTQLITGCYQELNVSGTVLFMQGACKGVVVEHGWYHNAGSGSDLVVQNVDGFTFENNTVSGAFSVTLGSAASNIQCLPHHNVLFTGWSGSLITRDRDNSISIVTSDRAGSNVNTAQNIFDSASDTLTLEASTAYEIEAQYAITRSAGTTSHTTAVLFGGTVTLTALTYSAQVTNSDGGAFASAQQAFKQDLTGFTLTAANTSATEVLLIKLKGILRTNAAGTLIPQFQYSAAPGGAPTIKSGSFFKCRKIGSSSLAAVGAWA